MGVVNIDGGRTGGDDPFIQEVRQNADFYVEVAYSVVDPADPDPANPTLPYLPKDITGWTGAFEFRYDDNRPVIFKGSTTDGAMVIKVGTLGIFSIHIPAAATLNFPKDVWADYDVLLINTEGLVARVMEGKAFISAGITLNITP